MRRFSLTQFLAVQWVMSKTHLKPVEGPLLCWTDTKFLSENPFVRYAIPLWIAALSLPIVCQAQTAFVPEKIVVEADVGSGPHLFVPGTNRIHVIDPVAMKYRGQISVGMAVKFAFSSSGDTMYVANAYYARGWTGAREDVVQAFDTHTLASKGEFPIASKLALGGTGGKSLAQVSSDGRWLFVQNSTPATSVTVADLKTQKFVAEIPTPGCWGIYPSSSTAGRFTSLCGDGRLATYTLKPDGSGATAALSQKIFDVDLDPLLVDAERDGDVALFMSFNGNLHKIDVGGTSAKLLDRFSITDGIKDRWAPGGPQALAYLRDGGVLYVLMHAKPYDGSHLDSGKELWAINVKTHAVLSRSTIKESSAITVAGGDQPMIYTFADEKDDKGVLRYAIDRRAGYAVREDGFLKLADAGGRVEIR